MQRNGWSGVKNGDLLARAAARFDVIITMDQNIEFQQDLTTLPIAVLIVEAISNRIEHLKPLVPVILHALDHTLPKSFTRVRA